MSKKINVEENNTAITANNVTIKELMEEYSNVSIRKLATAAEVTYGLLLKKSKEPIKGAIYDPEAINYDAIEQYLIKHEVDIAKLPWADMNDVAQRASTLVKNADAFEVGMKVYLRRNKTVPYEILFKTETHIVFMLEGTTEPLSWSLNTFMLNGPSMEPRTENTEVEQA